MEHAEESIRPVTDKILPWVILAGVLFVIVILVLGFFAILSQLLVPILIVIVIVRIARMFGGTGY